MADYQSQLEEGDEAEDEAAEEGEDAPQSDAVITEPDVPAAGVSNFSMFILGSCIKRTQWCQPTSLFPM